VSERDDFEHFVAARSAALLRTAYLLTGHHQDAEDLVQAALVKAVAAWPRITGDPEPYVRKIMVRENISRWRRRRWREVYVDRMPDVSHPEVDVSGRLQLAGALAGLAPRQRAVIVLRYYEDLTERETAELLGVSVGTVKSQARDALARLRTILPEQQSVPVADGAVPGGQ
jgi:RNA polymerase sigma-70 factor (sigma-E family)